MDRLRCPLGGYSLAVIGLLQFDRERARGYRLLLRLPAADLLAMLPPTCGNRPQRAAPWVSMSVSVVGESKITKWPYYVDMSAMP